MSAHTIPTQIHGRYLTDVPSGDAPAPMLVGFHGYAERAEHMLDVLRRIRGHRRWLLVSVQALNRFYTRNQQVVANWMTREDRDLAIQDNIAYVASVVQAVRHDYEPGRALVYVGFSQGVAMAYRSAAFGARPGTHIPPAAGVIALAGDVPPDVAPHVAALPPLLIGRGTEDDWYTDAKAAGDLELFYDAGVTPHLHVFEGGHEWDQSFVMLAGAFLDRIHP
jgi:predicted esterase